MRPEEIICPVDEPVERHQVEEVDQHGRLVTRFLYFGGKCASPRGAKCRSLRNDGSDLTPAGFHHARVARAHGVRVVSPD